MYDPVQEINIIYFPVTVVQYRYKELFNTSVGLDPHLVTVMQYLVSGCLLAIYSIVELFHYILLFL